MFVLTLATVVGLFCDGIFNVDTELVRDFRSWFRTGAWYMTWDCGCGGLNRSIKCYLNLVK